MEFTKTSQDFLLQSLLCVSAILSIPFFTLNTLTELTTRSLSTIISINLMINHISLIMNFFLLFCLSAATASVLRNELINIIKARDVPDGLPKSQIRTNLRIMRAFPNFILSNEQTVHDSPVTFDKECLEAHSTQSFLFVGCNLPKHCKNVVTHTSDHSLLGFESVYCLSFHQSNDSKQISLFDLSFEKRDIKFTAEFDFQPRTTNILKNAIPVSFFENFFIAKTEGRFYLLPRVCRERFTSDSHYVPSTFTLKTDDVSFCIAHKFFSNVDCTLDVGFVSMYDLFDYYDFPVSYDGAPGAAYSGNNIDQTEFRAEQYYKSHAADFIYPVSLRKGGTYLSNTKSPYPPKYIVFSKNDISSTTVHCFPRLSHYKPFLSTVLSSFLAEIGGLFQKIFDTLIECSETIAEFILKLLGHVVSKFLNALLPYLSPRIVPPLLAFPVAYFCFSDVIKSVIFSFFVFICV
ncbi:hypothetical protein 2 [Big Cypress virus]|uniref:hypothetical protein 2 n=1 Tax=Big Cypress virus TaxID=1955196 RepID=UPI000994B636|nr:hypothetical protein 2 [Big Cypress virus]AQM55267.1 hypothetical protein 2 [Big Cypress virus]AQM55270.1 hypothetical protein 2 [Big Cypress virus]AQM55273.1 hypothetical protein 2 [Big Cypress virus]AQM55276.1 hypothetical protein 2 [Big Cypress virus]AQM55279.1 hypothetical protein 2 [Big Cypress virus]